MPRVPDYQIQQSLGAPGTAVGVSQTMANTVRAAAGITGDLLEAGETVLKTFEKQQEIEDRKTILDARLGMQASLVEFEKSLQGVPPTEWADRFDEHANQFKSDFFARNYAPNVRRVLEEEANETFGRARIKIASQGLKQNLVDTRRLYGQDIDLLTKRGETEKAKARLAEAQSLGVIDEADAKETANQIDAFEQITGLHERIKDAPYKTLSLIQSDGFLKQFSALTLADQANLEEVATRAINQDRATFWESAVDAANNPTAPKVLTPEELQTLAEAGKITQTQRAKYLETYHAPTEPAPDPALYKSAIDTIRGYDPEADADGYNLAQLREQLANLPLPSYHRRELGKQLTAHVENEGRATLSGAVIPEALKPIQKHFSEMQGKYLDAGRFGGWWTMEDHDDNEDTAERKVINIDDYNKAGAQALEFQKIWEGHLVKQGDDYNATQAAQDFEALFREFRTSGPSPLSLPEDTPAPVDFEQRVSDLIQGAEGIEGEPGERGASLTTTPPKYSIAFSTFPQRRKIFQEGGTPFLLDTNYSGARGGIAEPLVVYPDGASETQKKQCLAYAQGMAQLLNEKFGRSMKGRIISRSENGRGRKFAFHTEPYALTDRQVARFMKTPEGMEAHRKLLTSTLGKAPGAHFFLPHSSTDPGAVVDGQSEVETARELLRSFETDLPAGALTEPRESAQRLWFRHTKPTNPREIREALQELDTLRARHHFRNA